ncbi:MAG: hypothetical protein FGM54_02365 [Chitinophagaceae bacterium]|jgi:hypothetical protein|nr:hypothetical protein [Chitinophagaceae bacterium]
MKRLIFLSSVLFFTYTSANAVQEIKGHPVLVEKKETSMRIRCDYPLDQVCALLFSNEVCIPEWNKCYVVTGVSTQTNSNGSTIISAELPFIQE